MCVKAVVPLTGNNNNNIFCREIKRLSLKELKAGFSLAPMGCHTSNSYHQTRELLSTLHYQLVLTLLTTTGVQMSRQEAQIQCNAALTDFM